MTENEDRKRTSVPFPIIPASPRAKRERPPHRVDSRSAGVILLFSLRLIAPGRAAFESGYDPATIAAVFLAVAVTCMAAAYWPSRRTMRIDPAAMLRSN